MAKSKCRVCGKELFETFSLGELYISNFIPQDSQSNDYPKSDLTMMYCKNCKTGQLKNTVDPDILYKKYWYYSGVNETMREALKDVVVSCLSAVETKEGDVFLDIASNDGTLLDQVPRHMTRIGVDPSDEDIMKQARQRADIVVNDYFSKEAYLDASNDRKAKIITCLAMFYDLEDPHSFLRDVNYCLEDDGLFVLQISYTPLMLKQLEFGNIVSEHVMYYNMTGLAYLLALAGFSVVDTVVNDVNGGSIRVYCTKRDQVSHFRNPQLRDVGALRMLSLLAFEDDCWYDEYVQFGQEIEGLKKQTREYLEMCREDGKEVWGYAASTKGNTLLQYFGLDSTLVTKIADRNSTKWGLKTIGSEIPICSEQEMREADPDYLLVLAWAFRDEFIKREQDFLKAGNRIIFPSPKFEVI